MLRLISPEEIFAARTAQGGWKKEQLAKWGVPWPPPKGWRKKLEREWRLLDAKKQSLHEGCGCMGGRR